MIDLGQIPASYRVLARALSFKTLSRLQHISTILMVIGFDIYL